MLPYTKNMERNMIKKHKDDTISFQGKNKKANYFEGWYFKHVSSDMKNTLSIIPGICANREDSHAFIQTILLHEKNKAWDLKSRYFKFQAHEFECTDSPFSLKIKDNLFSKNGIELMLADDEYSLKGSIRFSAFTGIKRTPIYPSAMGFFAYMPFMECYHDIISMNHDIAGNIVVNSKIFDFNNGKGYIEKDWGTSFPRKYIWLQSNHFECSDASIMLSVATIPFLGTSFKGFICNLHICGKEYRFATYNNSRIIKSQIGEGSFEFTIVHGEHKLVIKAGVSSDVSILKAPDNGFMNVQIKEGLSGNVSLRLYKNTSILFEDYSDACAIEVHEKQLFS